ncbi:MAG: cellulase family glycosylhydrolase [Bacteroidota bacterium]
MQLKSALLFLLFFSITAGESFAQKKKVTATVTSNAPASKWTEAKANEWYSKFSWRSGANYLPATAINQLEMWQEETFDTATIAKEFGWAKSIGFNTMRVYLHSLAWKQDAAGFKKRMDQYLSIADRNGIKTIFVFFDDCWNPDPKPGKQPAPKPGIHNSGWVQDPGQKASFDTTAFPFLETYVTDVLKSFSKDDRILLWDLYNEPGNSGKKDSSAALLTKVFEWARKVNPGQPISAGIWAWDFEKLNEIQLRNSDVVTYHDYEEAQWHRRVLELLKASGRPLICTEYMARTRNSRFATIMPMLKEKNIGAINWGFVAGKSNTIYAWDTPLPNGDEPLEWFHDIYYPSGMPYRQDEVNLIKKLNELKTP